MGRENGAVWHMFAQDREKYGRDAPALLSVFFLGYIGNSQHPGKAVEGSNEIDIDFQNVSYKQGSLPEQKGEPVQQFVKSLKIRLTNAALQTGREDSRLHE